MSHISVYLLVLVLRHSITCQNLGCIVVYYICCILNLVVLLFLYVQSSDPTDKDAWKDKGSGQLSIKCKEGVDKGTRESKPIIVVRNEVGPLILHFMLQL